MTPGAARLLLVRHGQTDANLVRALDTRPPGFPLNALGQSQAVALGARLAAEPVAAVYASRATRAQQTAAPIAAAHGLPVTVLDGVHEVFCGDLEGSTETGALELFDRTYAAWWQGDLHEHLPGGESAHQVRERFLAAIEKIMGSGTGTVVLVSHGAAIRLGAAALLGDTAETAYVPNGGLVVLRAEVDRWVLEHWDPAPPRRGDVTAGGSAI